MLHPASYMSVSDNLHSVASESQKKSIRKRWNGMGNANKTESSDLLIYFDLYFNADNMNTK